MRWAAIAWSSFNPPKAQDVPRLRSETRVVHLDVVAKDSHGRIVEDLAKEDFTLKDGRVGQGDGDSANGAGI
jgi:hypothetical protein